MQPHVRVMGIIVLPSIWFQMWEPHRKELLSFKPQGHWSGPILMSGDRVWLTVSIPVNPKAVGWG